MQEIEKSEQFIKDTLRGFPRKGVDLSGKKAVWLRVQNSIRDSRQVGAQDSALEPKRLSFIFRYTKLTATALSIALLAVLVTATATAAKTSLPGETLYPVKKAVEKVEKTLATTDEKKIQVIKKHTQNRLTEVQTLVATKQAPEEVVAQTLEDLQTSAKELEEAATAASDTNPELVDEAIELADERELALIEVGKNLEEGQTKTALNETLSASRESVAALKAAKGEVEGAAVTGEDAAENGESEKSTIIPKTKIAEPKEEAPSEIIESPIQIHDVIKGNDEQENTERNEPKILPNTDS